MSARRTRQRLALAGVALVATTALTGCEALADVFPKAFEQAEPTEAQPTAKAEPSPEEAWRRVPTETGDMSFLAHEDWRVTTLEATGNSSSTGIAGYEVSHLDGRVLATLQQNPGRSTLASIPGSSFTPIDSVAAPDADVLGGGTTAVVLDLVTHPNADSIASYGLVSDKKVSKEHAPGYQLPLGGGTQGYPKLAGPLRFEGRADLGIAEMPDRVDDAEQAAEDYALTQEYADIVHMLGSLQYHPEKAEKQECDGTTFVYESVNVDCETVRSLYHTTRIAEDWDSKNGSTVKVAGKWACTLKELGAELDGKYPGYGIDGECELDGGYGSFTAIWKARP
ncbi:hypothetical protein [Zhihengliuella salsuginis]|uniref:Lipoprotein n=1 Tax=Zhihengliuella salsuginis TaxID=578222 RepID=A0ABQ3GBF4_9MICC|nr:hypothetical protein [Zhihengliuella salsuginis]GHC99663.1 hypothetical protein GCM10008096_02060 [Zhihengliuella salsuginis]